MESDILLGAVHDKVYELLVKRGTDELTAISDTQALVCELQRDLGGRRYYIESLGKDARQRQIALDLQAGLSPAEVAAKHGVHRKTVEKITRKTRVKPSEDPGLGTPDWMLK